MSKVILYIATSEDGFIADSKGDVGWLPQPQNPEDLETVGYNQLMKRIGSIVMGSRSYQQILGFGEWGWSDKQTYVLTSKPQLSKIPCLEFSQDAPAHLIEKINKSNKSNPDIWLMGGATVAQSFAKDDLIDEIILTIIPVKLGEGIALNVSLNNFTLISEKPCMNGIVQRVYEKKANA